MPRWKIINVRNTIMKKNIKYIFYQMLKILTIIVAIKLFNIVFLSKFTGYSLKSLLFEYISK